MNRVLLAALALACVCSPTMAAANPAFDASRMFAHALFAIVLGAAMLGAIFGFARLMRCVGIAAVLAVLLLGTGAHPALANVAQTVAQPATDTAVVTIPYGSWLTSAAAGIQEIVLSVIMAVIAFACRRLPAAVGAVIKGLLTQQLVERAIAFGVSTVAGATAGKTLSVPVGNAVLANALNYVVSHAPGWFLTWAGGEQAIRDHIIALLPMEEAASLAPATSTAIAAQPTPVAPV